MLVMVGEVVCMMLRIGWGIVGWYQLLVGLKSYMVSQTVTYGGLKDIGGKSVVYRFVLIVSACLSTEC